MKNYKEIIADWEEILRQRRLNKQKVLGVVIKYPAWYWLELLWDRRN